MTRFRFDLQDVLALREHHREEAREQLAQALRALRILDQQVAQLERERAATRRQRAADSGHRQIDVERLIQAQKHELVLSAQVRSIGEQRERIVQEVESRRQKLVDADQRVRVLEKLKEQQAASFDKEQDRLDLVEFDEASARVASRFGRGEIR